MKAFPLLSVLLLLLGLARPSISLRPIRDRPTVVTSATWSNENALFKRDDAELNPYYWNITGIYKGTWRFMGPTNGSTKFVDSSGFQGVSVLELLSKPSKLQGVHYVTGSITFQDLFDNEREHARLRIEGVYVWPFRQLRMVANSGGDGPFPEEEYSRSNPYHLMGMFSNQVYPDPLKGYNGDKNALTKELEKYCNVEIAAKVSRTSASQIEGEHDKYRFEGLTEAPALDSDGECFTPILLNASSINVDVYYNKAVNYTLMVTFVSFFLNELYCFILLCGFISLLWKSCARNVPPSHVLQVLQNKISPLGLCGALMFRKNATREHLCVCVLPKDAQQISSYMVYRSNHNALLSLDFQIFARQTHLVVVLHGRCILEEQMQ